jgi:hypothetical protein
MIAKSAFTPTAYLKEGCPYSFKFALFMAEAGLKDHFDLRRLDPDQPDFDATKDKISAALGGKMTFPTVEVEPGRYESDSDRLIERYARQHGIDVRQLPVLAFYRETILPQLEELHEQHDKR